MSYNCPICDPNQDIADLREDAKEFLSVLFNGCRHSFDLQDLDNSLEEQRKNTSAGLATVRF